MNSKIKILSPDISENAIDHRGAIVSYIPYESIVEFVYITSKPNVARGQHYHKEFDEYILLTSGNGIYIELLSNGSEKKILIGAGQSILIPAYTPHTFFPLSECTAVSLLTKKWNDCKEPITPFKK